MNNKHNIRSAQLLSPFGIGQIINFPKEVSMMICGLHLWEENIERRKKQGGITSIDESALRINEPRLERLLKVEYFVSPFPYKTSGLRNNFLEIPSVRFPQWYYCTKFNCGQMTKVELTMADDKVECSACQFKMIPVRFVAVCERGHIQDVPFREWVHNGPLPDDGKGHILKYINLSGSGDLGSIFIKCSCGAGRSLAGLTSIRKEGMEMFDSALARIGLNNNTESKSYSLSNPNDSNPNGEYCKGCKPWLGHEGVVGQSCGKHLRVLIRGGSNIHYSNIVSALYIPKSQQDAKPEVEKVLNEIGREQLKSYYEQDTKGLILSAVLQSHKVVLNRSISKEDLIEGVIKELTNEVDEAEIITEEDLRQDEYKYILQGRNSENADFKGIRSDFEKHADSILSDFFECVVLVEKLRETRVFTGFSRINPNNSDPRGKMEQLSTKRPIKWLPAYKVSGEGIFLKFRDDKIDEWKKENGHRFTDLVDRYRIAMSNRSSNGEESGKNEVFAMMHTFAHLLIKRLCFNCGYGSSSLRERIYFSSDSKKRMNGILIYTSSGDSEGSLGGLVRQGRKGYLEKLVRDSLEDAKWCSADPVCSDIGQSSGQGPDNVNGSACHNCCLVPETSCEEFNSLLDRATIVGRIDEPEIGFFNHY